MGKKVKKLEVDNGKDYRSELFTWTPEAGEYFKAVYSLTNSTAMGAYDAMKNVAKEKNWKIPSYEAVMTKLKRILDVAAKHDDLPYNARAPKKNKKKILMDTAIPRKKKHITQIIKNQETIIRFLGDINKNLMKFIDVFLKIARLSH